MSPTVDPQTCSGCCRTFDLLSSVIWGDAIGHLCATCAFYYRRLRQRQDSVHLYWSQPEGDQ
jgi:hypothetical protein